MIDLRGKTEFDVLLTINGYPMIYRGRLLQSENDVRV